MTGINSASFRFSGVASGLDTAGIIDSLVKIQSDATVGTTARQAAGFSAQVSIVSELMSRLSAFGEASRTLTSSGLLGVKQTSSNSGFTAAPSSTAAAGGYAVQVTSLAEAAKSRSQGFASASAEVQGGRLMMGVNGTVYDVTIEDGATLAQVAAAVNASDAPVRATVLESNGQSYLSITRTQTGFTAGQPPESALELNELTSGVRGQPLGLTTVQAAKNATGTVDGLPFERSSNVVADIVPGTTLTLKQLTGAPEDLVLENDATATEENLQKWVDAYNNVMSLVRQNLAVDKDTDRTRTLAGDSALRTLQTALQRLVTAAPGAGSGVRSLADLGITSDGSGQLSIDSAKLSKAVAADGAAVNGIFQTASTGIGALTSTLVDNYTNGSDGLLTGRKKSLDQSVARLEDMRATQEARLEAYRARLIAQFTSMEKIVSNFKNLGNYLTQQDNSRAKSNG